MKKLLGTLVLSAAMLLPANSLMAQGPNPIEMDCNAYDLVAVTTTGNFGFSSCLGIFERSNDDQAQALAWLGGGWVLIGKTEKETPDNPVEYPFGSGEWNDGSLPFIPGYTSTGSLAITLKFGTFDGTWRFDNPGALTITGFYLDSPELGRGLSHATLYGTSTRVPEPASLALLATGMVGLVGIARRRRA